MLNRSMDGAGGVGAALGQPRLLVPVILTAAFNRSPPALLLCSTCCCCFVLECVFSTTGICNVCVAVLCRGVCSPTGTCTCDGSMQAVTLAQAPCKRSCCSCVRTQINPLDCALSLLTCRLRQLGSACGLLACYRQAWVNSAMCTSHVHWPYHMFCHACKQAMYAAAYTHMLSCPSSCF